MMRTVLVVVCLLIATQANAQYADLTPDQGKCILEHINVARTSRGALDVAMACVAYQTQKPELFNCITAQQVKAHSDSAASAIREACLAIHK